MKLGLFGWHLKYRFEAMEKDSEYKIFISQIYAASSRSELPIKIDIRIKQVMSNRQLSRSLSNMESILHIPAPVI